MHLIFSRVHTYHLSHYNECLKNDFKTNNLSHLVEDRITAHHCHFLFTLTQLLQHSKRDNCCENCLLIVSYDLS